MRLDRNWPTRMGNNQRHGVSKEACELPLKLAWKYSLGEYIWSGPIIDGETVYCTGSKLISLDLQSGRVLWENSLIRSFHYTSPAIGQDKLFVCAYEGLCAVEKSTGKEIYRIDARTLNSSACFDGASVYFYGNKEDSYYLFAIDAETGKENWRLQGEKGLNTTPSLLDKTLFYGCGAKLQAVDLRTGTLRWSRNLGGILVRDTTATWAQMVFASVQDKSLFALDARTGETVWQFDYHAGSHCSPCLDVEHQRIYVASGKLHALDALTGKEVWHSQAYGFNNSNPILVSGYIFIGGGLHYYVYGFDQQTGEKVWEYPTDDMVYSSPAFANSSLVIGSHDGYLYCFRSAHCP